jgi:hypothetical protein
MLNLMLYYPNMEYHTQVCEARAALMPMAYVEDPIGVINNFNINAIMRPMQQPPNPADTGLGTMMNRTRNATAMLTLLRKYVGAHRLPRARMTGVYPAYGQAAPHVPVALTAIHDALAGSENVRISVADLDQAAAEIMRDFLAYLRLWQTDEFLRIRDTYREAIRTSRGSLSFGAITAAIIRSTVYPELLPAEEMPQTVPSYGITEIPASGLLSMLMYGVAGSEELIISRNLVSYDFSSITYLPQFLGYERQVCEEIFQVFQGAPYVQRCSTELVELALATMQRRYEGFDVEACRKRIEVRLVDLYLGRIGISRQMNQATIAAIRAPLPGDICHTTLHQELIVGQGWAAPAHERPRIGRPPTASEVVEWVANAAAQRFQVLPESFFRRRLIPKSGLTIDLLQRASEAPNRQDDLRIVCMANIIPKEISPDDSRIVNLDTQIGASISEKTGELEWDPVEVTVPVGVWRSWFDQDIQDILPVVAPPIVTTIPWCVPLVPNAPLPAAEAAALNDLRFLPPYEEPAPVVPRTVGGVRPPAQQQSHVYHIMGTDAGHDMLLKRFSWYRTIEVRKVMPTELLK